MRPDVTPATDATPPASPPAPPDRPWFVQAWWAGIVRALPSRSQAWTRQTAWVVAGMALGLAVSLVFRWSAADTVVAAIAVGALSWLGKGIANVVLAITVVLGGLSAIYRTTMIVAPHQSWTLTWLAPLSVVLVVLAVLVVRRLGLADWTGSRFGGALLDLASGGGALLVALVCMHRLAQNSAAAILVSSEDNDAWLNTVGTLHNAHFVTSATTTQVGTFGPVIGLYLSFVRSATGGLLPGKVLSTETATAIVAGNMLLAVLCPVVAGLLARRTLRHGRLLLPLITWATLSTVLSAYALTFPTYGFLSAMLAILLVCTAAYLVSSIRTDLANPRSAVRWLAAMLVIYAAGSSWVPLVPLAGIALFVWYAGVAGRACLTGPWAKVRLAALLGVPVLFLGLALLNQYRDVISPIGGSDVLLTAGGGTPTATEAMIAGTFLVVVLSWLTNHLSAGRDSRLWPAFTTPLTWVVLYLVAILVGEAWVTRAAPHYGSIKLLYVVVGLALVLGVADLMASHELATRRLDAAAAVAVAALFLVSVDQGPLYSASAQHWPTPVTVQPWVNQVIHAVAGKQRVMCLGTTAKVDETGVNLEAYTCSRFASSMQGRDDAVALNWRFVQLGRRPVATSAKMLKEAKDRPWTIIVIGASTGLYQKQSWWAPIVAQGGLTFIHDPTLP